MEESISYSVEIKISDLTYCICFDKLNLPSIPCSNGGNHFVCMRCFHRIRNTCPQCQSNSLYNNSSLR
ncbi:hypothetical protein BC830DRAFT_218257 [Chytriomyces sp. MP71]|nr:hypothetical protein BC830DRAFT_218257 [Chytriomyces sp. MP71]